MIQLIKINGVLCIPCPFCGSPDLREDGYDYGGGLVRNWIECQSCSSRGPQVNENDSPQEAWNNRAIVYSPQQAEVVSQFLNVPRELSKFGHAVFEAAKFLWPDCRIVYPLHGEEDLKIGKDFHGKSLSQTKLSPIDLREDE